MKHLVQFLTVLLGAGVGGMAFSYAGSGAISWWFVVLMFVWYLLSIWGVNLIWLARD